MTRRSHVRGAEMTTFSLLTSLRTIVGKAPDFGRYRPLDTLEEDEFPIGERLSGVNREPFSLCVIGDTQRRTLVVGDIHGMFDYFQCVKFLSLIPILLNPFRKLLDEVQYNPAVDVLIHAGDLSAKGPLHGSIGVIDYMAQHNITGVRGNHDQKVIEWRVWTDWVQTLPGGKNWLEDLERRYHDAEGKGLLSNPRTIKQWVKAARKNAKKDDKKYWKLIPEGWKILTDHYFVARGLSKESFEYLSELPLKLYIPSAHAYVAHAGLLPFDPHYPADDKDHQPLAHLPKVPLGRDGKPEGRHQPEVFSNQAEAPLGGGVIQPDDLRYLQEVALITSIPQNLDPWVVLNMRSILKSGDVTRDGKTGAPWSDLWKRAMTSCAGFQDELGVNAEDKPYKFSPKKSLRLPCYPASVIYGHAASRGLDLKRWSLGLDSACVCLFISFFSTAYAFIGQGRPIDGPCNRGGRQPVLAYCPEC